MGWGTIREGCFGGKTRETPRKAESGLGESSDSPIMRNVLIAAGHTMLGLSMATATGRLASEILGEVPPHIDPSPYRLDRCGAC